VLAMLVGLNAGPNLTYTGSLATVPPVLAASTVALCLALQAT